MAAASPPRSAILWQNATRTVTLLDIPLSISIGQGTPSCPCTHQIYSSPALQTPYPSTEPKNDRAKANVLRMRPYNSNDVDFPATLLYEAHGQIAKIWDRTWCIERQVSPFIEDRRGQQPKHEQESCEENERRSIGSDQQCAKARPPKSELSYELDFTVSQNNGQDPLDLSSLMNPTDMGTCPNVRQVTKGLINNPCLYPLSMRHLQPSKIAEHIYIVPPRASFFLSKIDQTTSPAISMAALTMYPDSSATAGPGQFDFVLLDPPWENRSVKRSAKYRTMREPEPMEVLQSMMSLHLAPKALVACWITNKASVRADALEAFEVWKVQLVEEWAWLKTTEHGEPVTKIDGVWRKPYEILLIGKMSEDQSDKVVGDIRRRVIVAVPDFHSRKPNLKALVEPMLPPHYRALEVFARNMTAGWMAWGDQVLEYAWEGCYV